jgi:hypothetical protein
MDNATDRNKRPMQRVRFAATTVNPGPLALAEANIKSFVASLQSELASIIEKVAKEHLTLLSKLNNKKSILKKVEDNEDFIPRSARIEFRLTGSQRTELSAEFIALQEETSIMTQDYRKALRKQVIKLMKIEQSTFEDELREHLVTAIRLVAKSFLIAEKKTDDVDFKTNTLMGFFLGTISTNCPMGTDTFNKLYKKIHCLEVYPPPSPPNTNPLDDQPDIVPPDITKLNNIVTSVFVTPWTIYKEQEESNTVAMALKRLSTGYFTDRETAVAVSTVDLEPAADKPELSALIRKETHAEHQALRKELHNLRQQITSLTKPTNVNPDTHHNQKNSTKRGHGKGTSFKTNQTKTTTKSTPNNKNHKPNNNNKQNGKSTNKTIASATGKRKSNGNRQQGQQNQKAEESNNGTGAVKNKRKANNGNTSSTPNKNGSNKRRKQSSIPSKNGPK